jgi:hypothetical protein
MKGTAAVTWLRLSEATVLIDHDVQKARERLERAIKKAWLVHPPGLPQPTLDPNVPLRIQLTPLPGVRLDGRAWLDNPVLHWEASEIECLGKPWTPLSQAPSSAAATQCRVNIEVWGEDLVRLWGSDNSVSRASAENTGLAEGALHHYSHSHGLAVSGDPRGIGSPISTPQGGGIKQTE